MSEKAVRRVFVSYTGQDLSAHADVVAKVLRALQHLAVDHRDSGATGQPSVQWCMEQVDDADFLIVLVAHRYGWIPSIEDGGDGSTSITQMEVNRAKEKRKIVLPYIVEDGSSWPTKDIEALTNPDVLHILEQFKAELRKTVAAFFSEPSSLEGPLSRDVPKAVERLETRQRKESVGGQPRPPQPPMTPWIYDPNDPPSVEERMAPGLPKRILSIRGGGFEAAISIGYLERIERLLQVRYGDAEFRLADYFDLIGGIGPSSLLAVELARRSTVKKAAETFKYVIKRAFEATNWLSGSGFFAPRFKDASLRRALEDRFGDLRLGDPTFTTGMSLICTSLESSQPIFISNHPAMASEWGDDITLAIFANACFAIPTYFSPVLIENAFGSLRALMEGELSVGPDPGLMLLLLSTSPNFHYKWRLGQYRLNLMSVGSMRRTSVVRNAKEFKRGSPLSLLVPMLESLSAGAAYQTRTLLEALGAETPGEDAGLLGQSAALTYQSYETDFAVDRLVELGLEDLGDLSTSTYTGGLESFDRFARVGSAAAVQQVEPGHFIDAFDTRVPVDANSFQ